MCVIVYVSEKTDSNYGFKRICDEFVGKNCCSVCHRYDGKKMIVRAAQNL